MAGTRIMDQFALSCASYGVSKLAAFAQALITLGSVNSPEKPEHPEQDLYPSLGFSYTPSIAPFHAIRHGILSI
jgi:hypothetical protein